MTITDERKAAASVPRDENKDGPNLSPSFADLWHRYWATRDLQSRNLLLVGYDPLVHKTVARLPTNVRSNADTDDLYSFGVFGLIDAIDKCRPGCDLSRFPAYAMCRIRGTIIDELRRIDWVPRSAVGRASGKGSSRCSSELGASLKLQDVRGALRS